MDQNVCFSSGVLTTQSSPAQIELWLVGFGLNNVTTQSIQEEKRKNRRQSKGSVNVISEALGLQSLTFTVAWAASSVVSIPCDWLTVILKYEIWQTRAIHVSCVLCAVTEVWKWWRWGGAGEKRMLFITVAQKNPKTNKEIHFNNNGTSKKQTHY